MIVTRQREEILKLRQDLFSTRKEFGGNVHVQVDDRPVLSKSQENMDPELVKKINAELGRQATFNRYMDQEEADWKTLMKEGKIKVQSYDDPPSSKFCCFK